MRKLTSRQVVRVAKVLSTLAIVGIFVVSANAATMTNQWKLNETSGTTAADSVGGLDGTLKDFADLPGAWQQPGLDQNRIKDCCGKPNPYVTLPGQGALTRDGGFSITAWVTPQSNGNSQWIFAQQTPGAGASDRSKWELYIPKNETALKIRGGKQSKLGAGQTVIEPNVRTFVAFTYEQTNPNNPADGAQRGYLCPGGVCIQDYIAAKGGYYTENFDAQDNAIGANTDGNFGFDGVIQDLRIYNGALSLEEVQGLFDAGPVPEPTSAVLAMFGTLVICLCRRK